MLGQIILKNIFSGNSFTNTPRQSTSSKKPLPNGVDTIKRAINILQKPNVWICVEKLAKALLEKKKIGRKNARKIIKDAFLKEFKAHKDKYKVS